jgi:hypothetical protein
MPIERPTLFGIELHRRSFAKGGYTETRLVDAERQREM